MHLRFPSSPDVRYPEGMGVVARTLPPRRSSVAAVLLLVAGLLVLPSLTFGWYTISAGPSNDPTAQISETLQPQGGGHGL